MPQAVPVLASAGSWLAGNAGAIAGIAGAGAGVASALRKPSMPGVPKPLPTPDEVEIAAARRRRIAAETRMSGVASTLLGGGSGGTLG